VRRPVEQVVEGEGLRRGRGEHAHRDLRAVPRVLGEAADHAHGRARARVRGAVRDAVPHHRRDHAGAVAQRQAQVLGAITAPAQLGLTDQEHLVELGPVAHLPHEHGPGR
jgi:hypothetical protein